MFKLPHNCTHLTCQQSNAQNSPRQASIVCELRTSRCSSWIQTKQRNQTANCQHLLDHRKSFYFIDYTKDSEYIYVEELSSFRAAFEPHDNLGRAQKQLVLLHLIDEETYLTEVKQFPQAFTANVGPGLMFGSLASQPTILLYHHSDFAVSYYARRLFSPGVCIWPPWWGSGSPLGWRVEGGVLVELNLQVGSLGCSWQHESRVTVM